MFKEGSYIVVTAMSASIYKPLNLEINFIYRQRKDGVYLMPSRDSGKRTGVMFPCIQFDNSYNCYWRYANRSEIDRFKRNNEIPFDVFSEEPSPEVKIDDLLYDLDLLIKRKEEENEE